MGRDELLPLRRPKARSARSDGKLYFECDTPNAIDVEDDDGSTTELSADQVFETMFMSGHVSALQCTVFAMVHGFLPDDDEALVEKALIHGDPASRSRLLSMVRPPQPPETAQIAAFHAIFGAMLRAAWLDVPMLMNPRRE